MTRFTSGIEGVVFRSHGHKLVGMLYQAAGDGPRPTAIMLHGLPGLERNYDIAYALREAGWNAFLFHYRGCWGSEGTYSMPGILDDIAVAVEAALAQPSVNADRLALIGISLGGWAAIAAGANDPRFQAIVTMCPAVTPRDTPLSLDMATGMAKMLHGITPEEVITQFAALTPLTEFAPALAGRPVLLLGGEQDELFPPSHLRPLAQAVPGIEWVTIPGADHVFSAHRQPVVETVLAWLQKTMGTDRHWPFREP